MFFTYKLDHNMSHELKDQAKGTEYINLVKIMTLKVKI